jgi:hypothetical protein
LNKLFITLEHNALSLIDPCEEMKKVMPNRSRIEIINHILGGEMLITKRCQKCGMLIDEGDLRYHAELSRNNMTSCQEALLYESLP